MTVEASERGRTPPPGVPAVGADDPAGASTFGALRSRDFRVFWIGCLVSNTGVTMHEFALGWLVVELAVHEGVPERASLYAGLVGLSRSVPALVLGMVAGVVVDRVDRRRILLVEQSVGLLGGAGMAVLTLAGAANLGWVLVYGGIASVAGCFGRLARQAILPGLAGPARLMSAVGLNSSALGLSVIAGPAIGGLLIVPLGVGGVMLVNVAACVVALWCLALVPPQPTVETGPRLGVVASMRSGLAFVRDEGFVRWQLFLLLAVTMFAYPLQELLPAYVSDVLDRGAVELSWLAAAMGGGGLVATVVAPVVGARRGRGRVFVAGSLGSGAVLVLFGAQRSLVPAFALVAVLAFMMVATAVLCTMITQLTTPDPLLGRVIGVQQLVVEIGIAVGTLLLGAAGSVMGVGAAMAAAGVLLALSAGVVFARAPQLRAVP